MIQLANLSNFICPHQSYCHPNCYERQRRSCSRLITSVKKIYEATEEDEVKESDKKLEQKRDLLKERLKRRVSPGCPYTVQSLYNAMFGLHRNWPCYMLIVVLRDHLQRNRKMTILWLKKFGIHNTTMLKCKLEL